MSEQKGQIERAEGRREYVLRKIELARQAVARGEVVPHEAVVQHMAQWLGRE